MRVVMFVSGGNLAALPLQAMAGAHDICAVVRPARPRLRKWRRTLHELVGRRQTDPVAVWLRTSGIPTLYARSGRDERVAETLRKCAPDLICISTFPYLLHESLLNAGRLGAINVHPSLLPRHRGPAPLLWTYHANDRQTGVTIHRACARADAGPMVAQRRIPLERGYPIIRLHRALSELAGGLVVEAVEALPAGESLVEQDEDAATAAPRVRAGQSMVDFDTWDVERVWHFLHGVNPRFIEPLTCAGRSVRYRTVESYTRHEARDAPGTVERIDRDRFVVHCHGGSVELKTR